MPRALIALCLTLQAAPARYTLDAIRLRATAPLPAQQREVRIQLGGTPAVHATLLYDDGRAHLAVRDGLGLRGPSLRIADGIVAMSDPTTTWLAPDARSGLSLLLGPDVDPATLVDLVLGRAPEGHWTRIPEGARVVLAGVSVDVDQEGQPTTARVGPVRLAYASEGLTLQRGGLEARLTLGEPVLRDVPEAAFAMTSTEQLVWLGE